MPARVGSAASRLIAETAISDIDQLLLSEGARYVRYSDDFRFFCNSEAEAYKYLTLIARALIEKFDIRPADASLPARALSGGNQQKIVIAREMGGARDFKVLLASQPTRGVDVGAIEFIHAQLRAARDAGKGVLLVSADLNEVLALSDRIAVMYGGRVVAIVPGSSATAEKLGSFMTGAAA